MRYTWVAVAVAVLALAAAPAGAAISVAVTADQTTLQVNDTTTVRILVQATQGLVGIAGDIKGTVLEGSPPVLNSIPGSFQFATPFLPANVILPPMLGYPGPNGGWEDFAYIQPFPPIVIYANGLAEIAHYQVQANNVGKVRLAFVSTPQPMGYSTSEIGGNVDIGVLQAVEITVVPEPATVALLGLGGLLAWRRRRR